MAEAQVPRADRTVSAAAPSGMHAEQLEGAGRAGAADEAEAGGTFPQAASSEQQEVARQDPQAVEASPQVVGWRRPRRRPGCGRRGEGAVGLVGACAVWVEPPGRASEEREEKRRGQEEAGAAGDEGAQGTPPSVEGPASASRGPPSLSAQAAVQFAVTHDASASHSAWASAVRHVWASAQHAAWAHSAHGLASPPRRTFHPTPRRGRRQGRRPGRARARSRSRRTRSPGC